MHLSNSFIQMQARVVPSKSSIGETANYLSEAVGVDDQYFFVAETFGLVLQISQKRHLFIVGITLGIQYYYVEYLYTNVMQY